MTHTPGPWRVSPLDGRTVGPTTDLHTIDGVVPQLQAVAIVRERTGETDGNAHLVAAAPDLLEAAKMVAAMRGFSSGDSITLLLEGDVLRAVLAAIAKAEGRPKPAAPPPAEADAPEIVRQPVTSSNLVSIGYAERVAGLGTLEVAFRHGGCYRYFGVPASVYRELMAAPSIGSAFARLIKVGGYRYVALTPPTSSPAVVPLART